MDGGDATTGGLSSGFSIGVKRIGTGTGAGVDGGLTAGGLVGGREPLPDPLGCQPCPDCVCGTPHEAQVCVVGMMRDQTSPPSAGS